MPTPPPPLVAMAAPIAAATGGKARSPSQRPKALPDRRNTASYKHKESNHEKLRLLAHRLDRPMGEMLDEALERMFPEWVAELPAEPRF
jgi:hypothetical protein